MPRALLSVSDKTGLIPFAQGLFDRGWELVSTGGTARAIREAGLTVVEAGQLTGFGEMLDGRVKTLHPMVHAGILADLSKDDHAAQLAKAGIKPFGIVAVNLYPFESQHNAGARGGELVEQIDIGGPTMVRAAAKNHAHVAAVTDPSDYDAVLKAIDEGTLADLRPALAAKAFALTAYYDSLISRWLLEETGAQAAGTHTVGWRVAQSLRYGENPHQTGALLRDPLAATGIASGRLTAEKEMGYNNWLDAEAAWELACDLPEGACVIVKHGNPCGAAALGSMVASYEAAREADPISAFGGIVALRGDLGEAEAAALTAKGTFFEVIIARSISEEAKAMILGRSGWGANARLLEAPESPAASYPSLRSLRGGALLQDSEEAPAGAEWQWQGEIRPTEDQLAALQMAWTVVGHVKSNGIVVCGPGRLLGVGAGQMNRVQSVRLALEQAGDASQGAVLASDAFFPFPDSIETAAAAGIRAIVQPGGSKKDSEVTSAAHNYGIALAFTGLRRFRH
jgi:phosphoribosylaminoimidazolecarboxamide formyltransferase/IMP cyclohydrolase